MGPSGGMEQEAAIRLWRRSVAQHKASYTQVVCDGDAKTVTELNKQRVYADVEIIKDECVNHLEKRMYAEVKRVK